MPVEINYISIRRFADQMKDWTRYLFAKKTSIAIAAVLGCALGFIIAFTSKPSYTSNLTFVLSSDNSSGGGLLALANQFGFSFGNSNNAFSGENILLLFRSKKMFQRAFFKTIPDSHELLINRIGNNEYFFKRWKKDKRLAPLIPFTIHDVEATGIKDSLIGEIYQYATTHYFTLDKIEKNQNFYKITVVSNDESISDFLPSAMVDVTAAFYAEIKSEVTRRNLHMLNHEADSLKNVLNKSLQSSLTATDKIFNLNRMMQSAQTQAKKNEMQTRVLQQTYQTVMQNLEVAKITLQKVTPVYHIIDEPKLTLRIYKPGIVNYTCVGAALSVFFFIFFLLIRKTLQESD